MIAIPIALTVLFIGLAFTWDVTDDEPDRYGIRYIVQIFQYGLALICSLVVWVIYLAIV